MPAMTSAPFVDFTAEIAAWPEVELLPHLVSEIEQAVDRLFKVVCLWLDALVGREFVGLLKVTSAETARYHYFRPIQTERVMKKKDERTEHVSFDPTRPYGQRTQYEKRANAVVEITHELERHDHDIVGMRVHSIEEYPDPMPERIAEFLDQTPEFIRRHLHVVSGMIVREQVLCRTTGVETKNMTIVESTWLDSPAITLAGVYAPVGWNGRDMVKEPTRFFSGQKAAPPPPSGARKWLPLFFTHVRQHRRRYLFGTIGVTLLAIFAYTASMVGIFPALVGATVLAVIGMFASVFFMI